MACGSTHRQPYPLSPFTFLSLSLSDVREHVGTGWTGQVFPKSHFSSSSSSSSSPFPLLRAAPELRVVRMYLLLHLLRLLGEMCGWGGVGGLHCIAARASEDDAYPALSSFFLLSWEDGKKKEICLNGGGGFLWLVGMLTMTMLSYGVHRNLGRFTFSLSLSALRILESRESVCFSSADEVSTTTV